MKINGFVTPDVNIRYDFNIISIDNLSDKVWNYRFLIFHKRVKFYK